MGQQRTPLVGTMVAAVAQLVVKKEGAEEGWETEGVCGEVTSRGRAVVRVFGITGNFTNWGWHCMYSLISETSTGWRSDASGWQHDNVWSSSSRTGSVDGAGIFGAWNWYFQGGIVRCGDSEFSGWIYQSRF